MADKTDKMTILELETALEELRSKTKNPKLKKDDLVNITAILKRYGEALNERKKKVKQQVLELEKENNNQLIIFTSTKGWFKMIDRSALFYTEGGIGASIGDSKHLNPDTDHYSTSEIGTVSFSPNGIPVKKLGERGIFWNEKESTAEIKIFELPWVYKPEDVQRFVNNTEAARQKISQTLGIEEKMPLLYRELQGLNIKIMNSVQKMQPMAREAIGQKMFEDVCDIILKHHLMANNDYSVKDFLDYATKTLTTIKYRVKICTDLKILSPKNSILISDSIVAVQNRIEFEKRKLRNKNGKS